MTMSVCILSRDALQSVNVRVEGSVSHNSLGPCQNHIVNVNDTESDPSLVTCGVPQESI